MWKSQTGNLEARATRFGAGHPLTCLRVHTLEVNIRNSRYQIWIWPRTHWAGSLESANLEAGSLVLGLPYLDLVAHSPMPKTECNSPFKQSLAREFEIRNPQDLANVSEQE